MRSMTGFGRSQRELDGLTVRADIRSVNNKFLKLTVKLPEAWQGHQLRVETVAKAVLTRGTVTIAVRRRGMLKEEAACSVNAEVAAEYRRRLKAVAAPGEEVPLSLLVTLPGVMAANGESEETEDRVGSVLVDLVEKAMSELVVMRKAEGMHLAGELEEVLVAMEALLGCIEAGLPKMLGTYRERMVARINELLTGTGVSVAEKDVVREVAFFAERSDITEEIARLRSHVKQFRQIIPRDDAVGRQLEFLVQEMFRETNTMGSKIGGVEVGHLVLELRGHVDRLKEQVLNIE